MTVDWQGVTQALAASGTARLDPGLSKDELASIERDFGFRFPPDLRELLVYALPVGDRWTPWRGPREQVRRALSWPLEGLLFDVEHNEFWLDEWGPRPRGLADARRIATEAVASAPTLIPLYAHRYLPAEPFEAGNPVFSVMQTDIIVYGDDLVAYLCNEHGLELPRLPRAQTKQIRFWTALAEPTLR